MERDKKRKVKADSKSLRTRSNIGARAKIGRGRGNVDNPLLKHMDGFVPKTVFSFGWKGDFLSLNQRSVKKEVKDWWRDFFGRSIKPMKRVKKYQLYFRYNSALDVDNTVAMLKILSDVIVRGGKVKNDSNFYYKNIIMSYDKSLIRGEYLVEIQSLK